MVLLSFFLSLHCHWQFYFIRSEYYPYLLLMIVNKAILCKFLYISLSFLLFWVHFLSSSSEIDNWNLQQRKGPHNGIILLPNGIVIEIKNYLNAHFCFLWSIFLKFRFGVSLCMWFWVRRPVVTNLMGI